MKHQFCSWCDKPLSPRQTKFCGSRCRQADERNNIRSEFIKAYGGKCQCPGGCEVAEPDFLSLDHIHGHGDRHRRLTGTRGYRMYRLLKEQNWPKDNFRLLCYCCNMSRSHFGKCPHERRPRVELPALLK